MAKRTIYRVNYRDQVARFSDYCDALDFARRMSGELADSTGLIGQFLDGKATPEFAHLDRP